jgi:ABC-type Mn2+/Zn2+ transport system permease subunit
VLIGGWLLGFLSSSFGLFASYKWDLPTAPLIVAALSILYFLMLLVKAVGIDRVIIILENIHLRRQR